MFKIINMNLNYVEKALTKSERDKWSINNNHLCYRDGTINFLFDNINTNFFGFNKLILVSDGRLIKMSFFDKKRLHKLVLKKLEDTKYVRKYKAIRNLSDNHNKFELPSNFTNKNKSLSVKIKSSDEEVKEWANSHNIESNTESNKIKVSSFNKKNCDYKKTNKDELTNVSTNVKLSKNKKLDFKEKVELERIRIRKILRENKN